MRSGMRRSLDGASQADVVCPRTQLRRSAGLLIETSGRRGYNSIAIRATSELNRNPIVNRNSTAPATIAKRSGQAMVEFAIISFLLVTILTGILGLGLIFLRANIGVVAVASASNLLDMEISSSEIEGGVDYNKELVEELAAPSPSREGRKYFTETDLVIDEARYRLARENFRLSDVSLILEPILPLYQYAELAPDRAVFHFPGTIVKRTSDNELTVIVPVTNNRDTEHRQIISGWRRPIEFVYWPSGGGTGVPAKASVSITYPVSSGVLIAYRDTGEETAMGDPVRAPISAEISPDSVDLASVFEGAYTINTPGEYGYDSAYAYLTEVRIFQRVLSQSSTFRFREP
jgi:hypothetical protein